MEPQKKRYYDCDAKAWLRITFVRARSTGELVAQCTMSHELHKIISHAPEGKDATGYTIWQMAWQDQWYARQLEEDKTEIASSKQLNEKDAEETHDAKDFEAAKILERATGTGGDEDESYAAGREADEPERHTAIFTDEEPLPSLEGLSSMAQPNLKGRHWGSYSHDRTPNPTRSRSTWISRRWTLWSFRRASTSASSGSRGHHSYQQRTGTRRIM
jgi:hypothetical protein